MTWPFHGHATEEKRNWLVYMQAFALHTIGHKAIADDVLEGIKESRISAAFATFNTSEGKNPNSVSKEDVEYYIDTIMNNLTSNLIRDNIFHLRDLKENSLDITAPIKLRRLLFGYFDDSDPEIQSGKRIEPQKVSYVIEAAHLEAAI